jgi:dTDP-4-dehydrorhamnose 3,5-epimerase
MFNAEELELPGVFRLHLPKFDDQRGCFVKLVLQGAFASAGLRSDFTEEFFTVSKRDVVRGMHFQLPPHDHAKLVICAQGRILDVVLDLRRALPSYGRFISLPLDAATGEAIYIPPGCAHGFLVQSAEAVTWYNVTSVHAPMHDAGVHWQSFGFEWPVSTPMLSERDRQLQPLSRFVSPF